MGKIRNLAGSVSPVRKKSVKIDPPCKNLISVSSFTMESSTLIESVNEAYTNTSQLPKSPQETTAKTNNLLNTISELKQENKKFQSQLKETREKLLRIEEKSHEYYELYHTLLSKHQQSDQSSLLLQKENTHLKNQLQILQRHSGKLERKFFSRTSNTIPDEFCEFELEDSGWAKDFIVNFN